MSKIFSVTLTSVAWFHSYLCQMLAYNSPVMSRRCMQPPSRGGRVNSLSFCSVTTDQHLLLLLKITQWVHAWLLVQPEVAPER